MNLPRKWENAIDKAMKERIWGCSRSELQLLAYKLCALTQKPQRELTDAEIVAEYQEIFVGSHAPAYCSSAEIAFARAIIAAHQRKQQEPETVKFRAARRKGDGGVAMFQFPATGLPNDFWEWLEPAQEYEVTLP